MPSRSPPRSPPPTGSRSPATSDAETEAQTETETAQAQGQTSSLLSRASATTTSSSGELEALRAVSSAVEEGQACTSTNLNTTENVDIDISHSVSEDYSEYSEYEEDEFDPEWHARQNHQQTAALLAATATTTTTNVTAGAGAGASGTERTMTATDYDPSMGGNSSFGASSTLFANRRDLREEVDQSLNLMDASRENYEDPRQQRGQRVPRRARTKRESFTAQLFDVFLDASSQGDNEGMLPSLRRNLSRNNTGNSNGSGRSLRRMNQPSTAPNATHQRRLFYGQSQPPTATATAMAITPEYYWCTATAMENLCKLLIVAFMLIFIVIMAMPQGTYWIQEQMGLVHPTKHHHQEHDINNNNNVGQPNTSLESRLEALQNIILTHQLTSTKDLYNQHSAQYLAALWIADMDPAQIKLFVDEEDDDNLLNIVDTNIILQRYAVVTLYAELGLQKTQHNDPTGEPIWNETKWHVNEDWLTKAHICEWYGVDCEDNNDNGIPSDDRRIVVHLNLTRNNLHGSTLPSELRRLSDLVLLDISHNRIGGDFPDWISSSSGSSISDNGDQQPQQPWWQDLEYFLASNNQFQGSLPESLGNLTRLRELDLSKNNLQGTLPLQWPNNLRQLIMDHNAIEGTIPQDLGNLASTLERLSFFHNNLTGVVPSNIFRLSQLVELQLSYNSELHGTIPADSIKYMHRLELFALDNCHFTGRLPDEFENLTRLVEFGISNNHFRGSIPATLSHATNLEYLVLNKNPLTGTVPASFANLTEMVVLQVSETELVGSMPQEICDLKFDRGVDMLVMADCQEGRFTCDCCDKCF